MSASVHVPFVDLKAQYAAIAGEVEAAMRGVLERADFILGEDVARFEEEFAHYTGAKYAVGVGSGLDALEMVLRAWGIGPGDEVITAANTFIATALAVAATGARPVLVDCDPVTYNISPAAIEAAITRRTRALIPVHLYGQPAEMEAIAAIARKHHLLLLEDAAQAHGALFAGRLAGCWCDAGAFSFYPAKNLGAYGDGGCVVTSDAALAEKIRRLRNYGQREKYYHDTIGTNSRLDSLQAAVLRVKLRHLDAWNAARQAHAAAYRELLTGLPVVLPETHPLATHVYHLYVVQVEARDAVQKRLSADGVSTG
ncbi:MAG TPA: DegT/DnrJ/EryC1/StrS family aminotransferase, partial [Candidatus Acidoferrales bacterium]|nr:DegT/DnrJ/EryC1/StrS family aminotransferase [Candidatus Acidoferrales bacterium]